jgi:hypothetical protein
MKKELIEVIFVSDEDGHEYLIPTTMEDEFNLLIRESEPDFSKTEEEIEEAYQKQAEFSNKFDTYRLDGKTPLIFVEKGYESKL